MTSDPSTVERAGQSVASGPVDAVEDATERQPPRRSTRNVILALVAGVIVIDVLALLFVPGAPRSYPAEGIRRNFEQPAPHAFDINGGAPPSCGLVCFDLSITSSIITSWIVMAIVLLLAIVFSRGGAGVPGRIQNVVEYIYEALGDFAVSLGGPQARRYVPVFAAFFLFILFSNWSGLVPPVGRVEFLRAPTSDVNITLGLALVSFVMFHVEGVRALGVGGYLGKFFSLRAFKDGVGAGVIALFVGLIEFLLEFVKPITLAMRLFGNIFGGELALGVITALTIAVVPVALVGLEFLLNFVQAIIFSVLTLMFTLAAIEGHHDDHEEGHPEEVPEGNIAPDVAAGHRAPAH